MVTRNEQKKLKITSLYDQQTGIGCDGERAQLSISDAPFPVLFIPKEMFKEKIVKDLIKHGSLRSVLEEHCTSTQEMIEDLWTRLCNTRFKYDFEYFAISCVIIQDKLEAKDIPFKLNRGQRRLLSVLERMRKAKRPIRVILLKARQWGGSTLIQIYMSWIQIVLKENWSSVICAHVKDAAVTIRSMYEKAITRLPPMDGTIMHFKNFSTTQNIKHVPERGCRITVGSAEEPESVRSQDAKMAHFSEIGLYPNTEKKKTVDLIASITGTIPRAPLTLIAYESTARGMGDFFNVSWDQSYKGGSVFEPAFVPWFLIDIYSEEFNGTYINHDGKPYEGGVEDLIKTMNDYEKNLFLNHEDCTLENINWYRGKLSEMTSHAHMKQEYPSDPIEAFQDSGMPVYRAEDIEAMRADCFPPEFIGIVEGDASPSSSKVDSVNRKSILKNVKFIDQKISLSKDPVVAEKQTRNKLKVWILPDSEKLKDRFQVTVDTGGNSEKADFSVISIIDRYWMMTGGNLS